MAENTGRRGDGDAGSEGTEDTGRRRLRDFTKEDLVKDLSERQNRRKNRRRMTGDDVEEMFRDRAAKRRAMRESRMAEGTPDPRMGKISLAAGVVLLLAAAGMVYATTTIEDQSKAQVAAAQEEIISLNSQIKKAQPRSEEEIEQRREDIAADLEAAREKSETVAGLQNEFQSILAKGNDEEDQGNGVPKDSFVSAAKHRETLASYFDADSCLVEDDQIAYNAGSDIPFGDTEIDPRFQWYTQYTDKDHTAYVEPDKAGTWTVTSVVPSRTAEEGKISVTWLNRTPEGKLLAWAKATYVVEDERFADLTVGTTTLGDRYGIEEDEGGE